MNNSRPLVSILMNCYNSAEYLRDAIDSVISQTYGNWEIVFWDNQSTDESANIVSSYNDQRIKYFYAPVHTNLGEARNKALEKCAGEYIAFLDCDDFWVCDKLEKQVSAMLMNQHIDFCYTNYTYWIVEENKKYPVFKKRQPSGHIFESLLFRYRIGMLTVLIKKSKLDEMDDKFDPSLRLSEEFDLFMRILISSEAIYLDFISSTYRLHGKNCSIQEQGGWQQEVGYVAKKLNDADIYCEHAQGISFLGSLASFYGAMADLVNGDMRNARLKLKNIKYKAFKFFLAYIATFIPRSVWFAMRPLWTNGAFR